MSDAHHNPERERRLGIALHAMGAVVVIGAATAIGVWGYEPLQREQTKTRQLLNATNEFIATEESITTEARLVEQQLVETRREFEVALELVPETPEEAEFLALLSTLASTSRLNIREFRPGNVTRFGTHSELEIRVSAEGGYPSLCRFLAGLESLPRLCNVRALNVSGTGGRVEGQYPIDLTVVVFFATRQQDPTEAQETNDGTV